MFLFYLVVGFGVYYFSLRERVFDIPAMAFFSSLLYFLPAFFGVVRYKMGLGYVIESDITGDAYFVYITVIGSIILAGIYNEFVNRIHYTVVDIKDSKLLFKVLLITTIIVAILFIVTNFGEIIKPGKPALNRFHPYFQIITGLTLILSVIIGKYNIAGYLSLVLLLDVYAGNREGLAMAILGSIILILLRKNKHKLLLENKNILFVVIASIIFLSVYKTIYIPMAAGNIGLVYERIFNVETYFLVLQSLEPFTIQSILHLVIVDNFEYSGDYFKNIIYDLILFSGEMGIEKNNIDKAFNGILFATRESGVASNLWAEAYAIGGKLLIIIYAIAYSTLTLVYDRFLRKVNLYLRPFLLISASYLFLFIHRTGLIYQVTIQKRIILVCVFSIVVTYLIKIFIRKVNLTF